MTKLFRDVDYFVTEASNRKQRWFELDFADIIEVYDTNETTITTECGRTVIINWDEDGYFKSYHVIYETAQMESSINRTYVNDIISKLRTIDVDGETMQYILKKVGMEDQMLKQLISTADDYQINYYTDLRNIAKNN